MLFAFLARNLPSKLVPKSLTMGPEFSSDISGDGPRREDRDSKSTEESPTSDTKSGSSDHRPPTPPKPRGMSKSKYKNYVRKHRKKFPRRKPTDDAKCPQDDQIVRLRMQVQKHSETPTNSTPNLQNNDSRPPKAGTVPEQKIELIAEIKELQESRVSSSDKQRSDALRLRRIKRRLLDPETKEKELQERANKRALAGPQARKKDVEQQAKHREDFRKESKCSGLDDRKQDIESQAERQEKKYRGDRRDEYRRRTLARRKKRSEVSHEPFHFWTSNVVPSDTQLLNFEKDPGSAVAMFRLMGGLPKNHLRRPKVTALPVDIQGIIDKFATQAGHSASIRVCGVCGSRNIMTQSEVKEYCIDHKYIQILKCDEENITPNQFRLDCLHIITVDNEKYHLDIDGFNEITKQVTVCENCQKSLIYSTSRGKVPRQSYAF